MWRKIKYATYQQPPLPADRERVKSVGEERFGVLRLLPWSLSWSSWPALSEEGRDNGDAFWLEEVGSISGETCKSESGEGEGE